MDAWTQNRMGHIGTWVDTEYAGCKETRKSTSGGVIMRGDHMLRGWSTTQAVIALSSGEAEYYGMVKGATMGIGMKSLMGDMGLATNEIDLKVYTDASTAKSIANRKGTGQVRHIEVCQLWIQQEVANNRIEIIKVKGEDNISDILTKHVENATLTEHIGRIRSERRNDRHALNPKLAKDE